MVERKLKKFWIVKNNMTFPFHRKNQTLEEKKPVYKLEQLKEQFRHQYFWKTSMVKKTK